MKILYKFFTYLLKSFSLFKQKYKKKKTEYITLMFIPHQNKKIFSFQMSKIHIIFSILIVFLISITSTFVLQQTNSIKTQESQLLLEETSIDNRELIFHEYSKSLSSYIENMIESLEIVYKTMRLPHENIKFRIDQDNQYQIEKKLQKDYADLFLEIDSLVQDSEKLTLLPIQVQNFLTDFSLNKQSEQFQFSLNVKKYKELSLAMQGITSVLQTIIIYLRTQKELVQNSPFEWPLKGGHITSYYGRRISPFGFNKEFHKGIDIANRYGTPVYATANGKIRSLSYSSLGYGNKIIIKHRYGYSTTYAHLSKIIAKSRTHVRQGDLIGYVGTSGRSTGPHLHYEIKLGHKYMNPLNYTISAE